MTDRFVDIPPRPPLPTAGPAPQPHPRASVRLLRDPRGYLVAYLVALAAIAFWPAPVDRDAGPLLRSITHLFPVLTYARIEFTANILLFVPFGLLLTLIVARSHRWIVLPVTFLATVTIESVQAVMLDARTPSVLDIIANTAGACLGMLIAVFIEVLRAARTVNSS